MIANGMSDCFNPLWINTALKQCISSVDRNIVSIPYGLTLLSNTGSGKTRYVMVSIPYGLTLLSNPTDRAGAILRVSIPYGLTLLSNSVPALIYTLWFQSPMD